MLKPIVVLALFTLSFSYQALAQMNDQPLNAATINAAAENLKNCTSGDLNLPVPDSPYFNQLSAKVIGWENGKCHLTMSVNLTGAKANSPGVNHMMTGECYLSSTTLAELTTAWNQYQQDKLKNVDPNSDGTTTLIKQAVQQYMRECNFTVDGRQINNLLNTQLP